MSYNPLDIVNASDFLRLSQYFYTDILALYSHDNDTYNSLQGKFSCELSTMLVDIFLRHAFNCREMKQNI
jgi:hypothetical protein